jgi:hypothetical protein
VRGAMNLPDWVGQKYAPPPNEYVPRRLLILEGGTLAGCALLTLLSTLKDILTIAEKANQLKDFAEGVTHRGCWAETPAGRAVALPVISTPGAQPATVRVSASYPAEVDTLGSMLVCCNRSIVPRASRRLLSPGGKPVQRGQSRLVLSNISCQSRWNALLNALGTNPDQVGVRSVVDLWQSHRDNLAA